MISENLSTNPDPQSKEFGRIAWRDPGLFFLFFLLTLSLWFLASEFRPGDLVGRNDATSGLIWLLRDLGEKSLDELSYHPGILGGYPLVYATGSLWPLKLAMNLFNLSHFTAHNFTFFLLQTVIGYFGLKVVRISFPSGKRPLSLLLNFSVFLIFAFAPVLGWRFAYGHLNLILGAASFLSLIYLIDAWIEDNVSIFDYILSFTCLSVCLNFVTFQVMAYSLYLLPLYFIYRHPIKVFPLKQVLLFSAIFFTVNAYFLFPFIGYYLQGQSTRSHGIDVFSYAPPSIMTLASSFLYKNNLIDLDPVFFKWHELHYPAGFSLLGLLAFLEPRKKNALTLIGLIVVLLFLLQVEPFKTLVGNLPLVSHFRVPQRILILLILLGNVAGIRWFLSQLPEAIPEDFKKDLKIIGLISLIGLVLNLHLRAFTDILLYLFIGIFFATLWKREHRASLATLLLIGFVSVSGFFTHFLPAIKISDFKAFNQLSMEKRNPFERTFLNFRHQEFHGNTGFALGLPVLDGYFYASKRFSELLFALQRQDYDPTHLGWSFADSSPLAPLLARLYNIQWTTHWMEGELRHTPFKEKHPDLIIPEVIRYSDDIQEIASLLKMNPGHVFLSESEKEKQISACDSSSVTSQYSANHGFEIRSTTTKDCLVVIPTNYISNLRLTGRDGIQVRLLPANHALLGVLLPAGVRVYQLRSKYFAFEM